MLFPNKHSDLALECHNFEPWTCLRTSIRSHIYDWCDALLHIYELRIYETDHEILVEEEQIQRERSCQG